VRFTAIPVPRKPAGIFLVHPGGPFWAKKDMGAWSIPKGEFEDDESPLDAAIREMKEETGIKVSGTFIELNPVKQKGGKVIYAWAIQMDFDPAQITSNSFELEWPPKSGKKKLFPEIDKAAWFNFDEVKIKIIEGQASLISELKYKLTV
jgi:predicted NUDIX family NTP pyrophosphohydrolase